MSSETNVIGTISINHQNRRLEMSAKWVEPSENGPVLTEMKLVGYIISNNLPSEGIIGEAFVVTSVLDEKPDEPFRKR